MFSLKPVFPKFPQLKLVQDKVKGRTAIVVNPDEAFPIENQVIIFLHRCCLFPFKLMWGIFNPHEFAPVIPEPVASYEDTLREEIFKLQQEREIAIRGVEDWASRRDLCDVRLARLNTQLNTLK